MADFDQLIKEKVDKAQYPYKASAWKRFAQKAGFKAGMTPLLKVVVSVAMVAVVGGGTLGIVSAVRHQQPTTEPTTQCVQDTASSVSSEPTSNTVTTSSTSAASVSEKSVSAPKTASVGEPAQSTTANPSTATPKVTTPDKNIYGRPLIINPDTIKTNEPTEEQLRNGHSRI